MKTKRMLSLLLTLALLAGLFTATALADGTQPLYQVYTNSGNSSGGFNAGLTVEQTSSTVITVTVEDSAANNAILAAKTPTLTIPCTFARAEVTGSDGRTRGCTASGTAVSFPVNRGGAYTIRALPAPAAASGKHRITVEDTENGSVTVEPSGAKAGETASVTVTPDAGYAVEDITITDRNGNKVKFRLKDGKYIFEMPESGVTVQVKFARSGNPFVDVPEGKYFYDAVLWAVENGITGGVDATHFSPYASCTRGQLVTFLWRAAGEPTAKNAASFTDVAAGRYCEDAVAWAAENGIVGGYDDGAFRPDATITRQQTAAILWRFAKYAGMDVSVGEDTNILSFSDALAISDYAFPAIQWAVGAEVMGGSGDKLLPRDTCTRAQIVTMLYRCIAE